MYLLNMEIIFSQLKLDDNSKSDSQGKELILLSATKKL